MKVFPYLLLFAVANCQLFGRPDLRHSISSFLRPPMSQRYQRPSPGIDYQTSANIISEVRAQPQQESFIEGATPFFKRPQPSVGELPLSPRPSFQFAPPRFPEQINELEIFSPSPFINPHLRDDGNNAASVPDADQAPTPEVTLHEVSEQPIDESKVGHDGLPNHSEVEEDDFSHQPTESPADTFSPFSLDIDEPSQRQEFDEIKNHKREAHPQQGFIFPSFQQATNHEFENFPFNGQRQSGSVEPSQDNVYTPPVYRPQQEEEHIEFRPENSPSGFNPPDLEDGRNPDHLPPLEQHSSFDSELRLKPRPQFELSQQKRPIRPIPERPKFQLPEHRPSEEPQFPRFNQLPFRGNERPSKPYDQVPHKIEAPSGIPGGRQKMRKGVSKRKPFKAHQVDNSLYEGAQEDLTVARPEEEEDKPDRLSILLQQTSFNCVEKQNGYYADEELGCEVFHFCQDKVKHSWLCPNGGAFHQVHLICLPLTEDNICEKSSKFHFVNDYLYQETQGSNDRNRSYVQRYYPDGYEEGIAALEERHGISSSRDTPQQQYELESQSKFNNPQHVPRTQYNHVPPRQVQSGQLLRQAQQYQFSERGDTIADDERQDYFADSGPEQSRPPSLRPFSSFRTGMPPTLNHHERSDTENRPRIPPFLK